MPGASRRLAALAALFCAARLAAGPAAPGRQAAAPARGAIELSLFLIGDAGDPAPGGEPVLTSLRRELGVAGGRAAVAFLGDNLYPAGLPAASDPKRPELERRIDDQVDAVRDTGARIVFVPGNHDWDQGGRDGWAAVKREEERVEARGGAHVSFLPDGGCPGPAVLDVSERLRLLALDTQWWLHAHARPEGPDSGCAAGTEAEVADALRAALASAAGRDVVVIGHHPLVSGGPHGGHFTFRQHVFPLTDFKRALWLPLPLIGSLYPAARGAGLSHQDIANVSYRRMRDALATAARAQPPLAWAGGHEHTLEVIESPEWGRVLVSGAGIYGHRSSVGKVPGSLFYASRSGYMRIDFLGDGSRRLAVVEVERDGSSREAFARRLDPQPVRGPAAQ